MNKTTNRRTSEDFQLMWQHTCCRTEFWQVLGRKKEHTNRKNEASYGLLLQRLTFYIHYLTCLTVCNWSHSGCVALWKTSLFLPLDLCLRFHFFLQCYIDSFMQLCRDQTDNSQHLKKKKSPLINSSFLLQEMWRSPVKMLEKCESGSIGTV